MQKHFKKIISALAFFAILFCGVNLAHAEITFNLPSPQPIGADININMSIGDVWIAYDSSGNFYMFPAEGGFHSYSLADTFTLIECNSAVEGSVCPYASSALLTLTEAEADPGFISETTFTFTALPPPPPTTGLVFFGGTSSGTGTGTMDSTSFLANVASAYSATGVGIYPIVAIIAGLILTFILIKKIIGLSKQTGKSGQGKMGMTFKGVNKSLKKQTTLYNKDGKFAGYRFD